MWRVPVVQELTLDNVQYRKYTYTVDFFIILDLTFESGAKSPVSETKYINIYYSINKSCNK